jgi:hypothetical protein
MLPAAAPEDSFLLKRRNPKPMCPAVIPSPPPGGSTSQARRPAGHVLPVAVYQQTAALLRHDRRHPVHREGAILLVLVALGLIGEIIVFLSAATYPLPARPAVIPRAADAPSTGPETLTRGRRRVPLIPPPGLGPRPALRRARPRRVRSDGTLQRRPGDGTRNTPADMRRAGAGCCERERA